MIFFISWFILFAIHRQTEEKVFILKNDNILTYSKLKEDLPQCFIHNKVDGFNLNQYIDIYEDSGGVYTKNNIQSVDSLFKNNTGTKINSDKVWLRLKIDNQFKKIKNWYLYLGPWERITAFKLRNDSLTEIGNTGVLLSFDERQTKIRTLPYIKLTVDNKELETFYFKVERSQGLQWFSSRVKHIYGKLFSEESILSDERNKQRYLGFCLGIAGFVILFNLILYVYTREYAYVLNALYLLFWNLLFFSLYGFIFEFIMGSYPFWNIEGNYISIAMMLMIYSLLTKRYTYLPRIYSKWNKIFNTYIFLILMTPILRFFEYWSLVEIIDFVLLILIFSSSIWVGIKAYRYGIPDIKFFLFGQIFFPFVLLYFFVDYEIRMSFNYEAIDLIQFAVMVQVISFSMGIASGLKTMEWELFLKKQLESEMNFQAKNLHDLNESKSRFFANISHEFRTPLTLILGPLNHVIPKVHDSDSKDQLKIALSNANRLLNLINQILDVSKLQKGAIRVEYTLCDLTEIINKSLDSFRILTDEKSIKLKSEGLSEAFFVRIDNDIIQKVMYNLLSNAVKFTPKNGKIIVSLKVENKNKFEIIVEDNGTGISDENIDKIFERFFQVDAGKEGGYEGSGIGLALCKEMLELSNAQISVYSNFGKGSRFVIEHPILSDQSSDFDEQNFLNFVSKKDNKLLLNDDFKNKDNNKPIVLIVEDNKDMVNFISQLLKKEYELLEAKNGKEGVDIVFKAIPDIIICDIMMPKMDGYAFTDKIKKDERTNHIPIILLTGKVSKDSKIKGLLSGADLYMEKPFDTEELKLNIRNTLNSRYKLREKYQSLDYIGIIEGKGEESEYLKKVINIIENNMEYNEFSVEQLANKLGMSQSNLYRKIKSICDYSPNQFIRLIRLKHAAKLLQSSEFNISEVAYKVGFNSLAHFTNSFKEEFGFLPSDYRDKTENSKL